MTHPYFVGSPAPRVLAHRGLPTSVGKNTLKDTPAIWENSALAVAAAHAAGATYVETDCRLTADGDVVLFHDATLARLLDDPRPLNQVSTAELTELMSHNGGLLTVSEALDAFPTIRFNIDVKEDAAARPIGAQIARHSHRVLLTSFDDRIRRRAVASALDAGASIRPATSAGQATIARLRATSLSGSRAMTARTLRDIDAVQIPVRFGPVPIFSPTLVRAAHRLGVEVHVWTINDPEQMRELVSAGADGIVTDHADVALSTLSTA